MPNEEKDTNKIPAGKNSSHDVTLSPAYLEKLETELQKALENSVKFVAQETKKELQTAIDDVASQNKDLVDALKTFEDKLINSFQSLAEKLYSGLSDSFNQTVSSIQSQNKELVSSVDKLEDEVRDKFQGMLSQSLNSIANELSGIAEGFKEETHGMVEKELRKELEDFQETMRAAQQQTVQSLSNMYKDIESKKKEMEDAATKEVEQYKKQMMNNLNNKLDSAVVSFLLENLGESLDIDAQKDHIFEILNEYKEEIKKDLHA